MFVWVGLSLGCRPPEPPPFVEQEQVGEVLLASRCEIDLECKCPDLAFDDEPSCREARELRISDTIMVAEANELHYDGVCVAELLELREATACAVGLDIEEAEDRCLTPCKPFHGDVGDGDACEKLGITVDVDNCAQGLRCVDAVCVPLCDAVVPIAEGEVCRSGLVDVGDCEPSHYCDEDGRCAPATDIGSACDEVPCVQTAFCERTSMPPTCAAKLDGDEPCTAGTDCRSDTCADGRCVEVIPLACEP